MDDGEIVYANPRFEKIYGYDLGELAGRHVSILNASSRQDPQERAGEIIQSVREQGFWKGEVHNVKKDGTEFWSRATATVFEHIEYGTVLLAVQEDITERREAEEVLRLNAQIMNNMSEGVLLTRTEDEAIVYTNSRFEKVFGYGPGELIGQHVSILNASSKRRPEETAKEIIQAAREQGYWSGEIHNVKKDGTEFWSHTNITTFGHHQYGEVWLSVQQDITERIKAEEERARIQEQMQQVQKLESLGVLAGGIAHDFNNLLAAILGNADLALNELSPTSRARSYLNDIVASSERAADLSRQMLAYSGRGRFVLEALSLNALVHEIGQLLKTIIGKKVSLQYDLMRDLPLVEGDATQIRQILMNLVTNASEAIGEDPGTISISTGLRTCNSEFLAATWLDENLPAGEYVYFEFADTGCGMNQADLERIFDPFFTTKFTGRGLGLAATLGIVRGHRGAVNVESTLGEGTRFTVFLPRSDSSEPPADMKESANSVKPQQYTVLLVDDEPFVLKTASSILQKAGYTVLTAIDGRKALDVYNEHASSIGCVLLDLTMPEMDGEETFDELRQLGCEVPILLCSGFDSEETAERFGGKDVAGFLQKPYRMKELLGKLSAALGP